MIYTEVIQKKRKVIKLHHSNIVILGLSYPARWGKGDMTGNQIKRTVTFNKIPDFIELTLNSVGNIRVTGSDILMQKCDVLCL